MAPTQDDLIKNLLLQPRLLELFLHAFLPEVFEFADFKVLEYLDKEHPRSGRRPQRRGDLLIKVRWRGKEGMFLIHIESQGQAQDVILQRAAEYAYRDSIQYKLPVMPMVLLTYSGQSKEVPNKLDWQFGKVARLHVTCPILHFQRMDPTEHLGSENVCALALASVMKLTAEQRVEAIVQTLAETVRQRLTPSEEQALVEFAVSVKKLSESQLLQLHEKIHILSQKNKRLSHMPKLVNLFEEVGKIKGRQEGLQSGLERGMKKGLLEGRQEGRQEGELALVQRQFARKFPKLSVRAIAQISQFDEETLLSFGEALLFMQEESDCKAWLKAHRS